MLVGIEIDKLNFENNVSTICKKANNQLTAISRIGAVLGQKDKETLITLLYIQTLRPSYMTLYNPQKD